MTLRVGVDFDGNGWVELFKESGDANNLFSKEAANIYDDLYRTVTAGAITVASGAIDPVDIQYYGNQSLSLTALDTNDRIAIGYNGSLYNVNSQDSGTYGGSVYVKSTGTPTVRLRLISSGGTSVNGSTVVASTSWQQVTVSGSLPHAAQSIRIEVECTSGASTDLIVVAPMIVSGSILPTYLNCGAYSLNEDISDYVQSARWASGFVRPYQYVAGVGRARITLVNDDKRFSPEAGGSIWSGRTASVAEMLVRINADATILWTGYVTEWKPQAGLNYSRLCELTCEDARKFLENVEIFPDLKTSATPAALIEHIVDLVEASAETKITMGGGWSFGADPQGIDFDGSVETETVPYYFDQTPNESDKVGQQPVGLLEDILKGIQAKVWFARHGSIVLDGPTENGGAVAATFDNTAIDLDYEWGQNIINECTVKAYPRRAGSSTTRLLWRLRESLTVAAGATEVVRAYFTKEGTDTRCGSEPGTVALANLTYSGASIAATITDVDAMSCEISVVNSAGVDRDWTTGDVLGRELSIEDTISRTRDDSTSVAANGRKGEKIDSWWVAKGGWAKRLAQFRVNRFKDARGEVTRLTGRYDVDAQFADCYIGKKINVVDDQLGHDGNYIVIGEDHDWRVGGEHRTRLYLEPTTTTKVSTTSV